MDSVFHQVEVYNFSMYSSHTHVCMYMYIYYIGYIYGKGIYYLVYIFLGYILIMLKFS